MSSFRQQVSSSIRILGWNRDASARATHLKAADGNVPFATIERKSMSTKTSIKRVALVAAAALMTAGFSAVSAHAADNTYIFPKTGDGVSNSSVTGAGSTVNGVAGPANYVTIGFTGADTGIATVSGAGATFGTAAGTGLTVNTAGTQATAVNTSGASVTVATPSAGTVTVNYYKYVSAGVYAATATESVVITVNAAASSGVYSAAKSSVYIAAGETNTIVTADAAVVGAATTPTNTDSAVATIQVQYKDSLGASMPAESITATISGPGVVKGISDTGTISAANGQFSAAANTYSSTVLSSANGSAMFEVFNNGQVGTSTITIKNNTGVVLGTKTVTFSGTTAASLKLTVKKAYVLAGASTIAIWANQYDSAGNEITVSAAHPTVTVASGTSIASATCSIYVPADGAYECTVVGTSATSVGDSVLTFTASTGTSITASATVHAVLGVANSITITGPASADPSTSATYTLTALDSNGQPLPDGAYAPGALIASVLPSQNLVATPFNASETITLAGGVATDTTYVPAAGTLTITWTLEGTAATTDAHLTKAIAATTVNTVTTINGSADAAAATDAANAATDAANAAADAADNATQAASEALAAVNSLATTVASLIAGIKAQITSLTNLITKIKNKVGA